MKSISGNQTPTFIETMEVTVIFL